MTDVLNSGYLKFDSLPKSVPYRRSKWFSMIFGDDHDVDLVSFPNFVLVYRFFYIYRKQKVPKMMTMTKSVSILKKKKIKLRF